MSTLSEISDNHPFLDQTQRKTEKGTRPLTTVAALFLSLLIFGLLGEFLVRIFLKFNTIYDIEMSRYAIELKIPSENPKIGHKHKPNSGANLMNVDVRINSDGLRDREHTLDKNGHYRMAFLGDSLTFGWGVKEGDSFKSRLEQDLSGTIPVDILNFGTGNYNTEQEVNLFLEKGLKYNPNKVVVFYFINDAEPTRPKSFWSFLEHSRMFSFYWSRINNLMGRWNPNKSFRAFYSELYDENAVGWKNTKTALSQLSQECKKRNIELQVVLLPELHNLKDYPFEKEHQMVINYLNSLSVNSLDLTSFFRNYPNPMELWVSYDDAHPNSMAHKMIADSVRNFIKPVTSSEEPK